MTMFKDVEHEAFVAKLWREFYTPWKPTAEQKLAKRPAIQIPQHPLTLASADFNEVVREPAFLAYHADRAARGAQDPLALQVAEWIRDS